MKSNTHPHAEAAADRALRLPDELADGDFTQMLHQDPELRDLLSELEDTAAAMALAAPQSSPPPELKAALMEKVRSIPQERFAVIHGAASQPVSPPETKRPQASFAWIPWAAAAGLAVISYQQWSASQQVQSLLRDTEARLTQSESNSAKMDSQLQAAGKSAAEALARLASAEKVAAESQSLLAKAQQENSTLVKDLAALTKSQDSARTQIATLQATLTEYRQGVAVVVWNQEKQQGILKLEKMPAVQTGKDYQLWVVDTAHPTPVNAGVVRVDDKGFAKIDFKPVEDVINPQKFALSVEQVGGVPQNKGPIVLLSD
jgi:hypothetical protein